MYDYSYDLIAELYKKAEKESYIGEAGGGMVKVFIKFAAKNPYFISKVEIEDSLFKNADEEGKQFLSDLIVSATNNAIEKVNQKVVEITETFLTKGGGFGSSNLPPLDGNLN